MTDIKTPGMSLKDQIKLAAKNEVDKEIFEQKKKELVALYKKLDQAKRVVKNIENEITDYEMEIKE